MNNPLTKINTFKIKIEQKHIDRGRPGFEESCPLALGIIGSGYMYPLVDDLETRFLSEDGRDWIAATPKVKIDRPMTLTIKARNFNQSDWLDEF